MNKEIKKSKGHNKKGNETFVLFTLSHGNGLPFNIIYFCFLIVMILFTSN